LARWGLRGGVDRQILAHFKLGEIAWNNACPRQRVHGSCVSVEDVPTGQASSNECPSPRSANLTVYDRGPRLAKEGQDHFKQVVKLWDADYEGRWLRRNFPNPSEAAVREDAVRFAVAGAAFYRAEQVYEACLKLKVPSGIYIEQPTAFDSRQEAMRRIRRSEESLRKFQSYRDAKSKHADKLAGPSKDKMGLYDLVLDYHVDYWSVAAFARIGQVYKESANQLHALRIPKDFQEQDEWGNRPRKIFCDSLADLAKPFVSKAVFCFGLCLRATSEGSSFSDWSTLCEGELNQLRPKEYPLPAEAVPEPSLLSIPIAPAALISNLPEAVDVTPGQE